MSSWKLCEKCPICGSAENHSCSPYVVDTFATARNKAAVEIPKADLCVICELKRAVADFPPPHSAPICAECMDYRKTHYPDRDPCIPREVAS